MPGPNRWNIRESTARGSNDPPNQGQDDQAYQSEDSEYDTEYTASQEQRIPQGFNSTYAGISCRRRSSRIQLQFSTRMPVVPR